MRVLRAIDFFLFEKELSLLVGAFLAMTWGWLARIGWLYYLSHHAFALGDWLINYHTGWVRRGLSGEIILWLARLLGVSPGLVVWLVWVVTYGAFFSLVYWAWAAQKEKWPFLLLIFSPLLFTFPLQVEAFPRKEILSFLLLFLLVVLALYCSSKQKFRVWAYVIFLMYPFLLLSHEALILLLPYFVGVYLWKMGRTGVMGLFALILLSLGTFGVILSISMRGPVPGKQVANIYRSIAASGYPLRVKNCLDPISALGWNWSFTKQLWVQMIGGGMVKQCGLVWALSMVAFIPVWGKLKVVLESPVMRFLLFVGILGTFVLSLVAIDWGRFFRMQWVGLFAWVLLPTEHPALSLESGNRTLLPLVVVLFAPVYAASWQVSFQCYLESASLMLKSVVLLSFAFVGVHFVYAARSARLSAA